MKAVCWERTHQVAVEDVPDPSILNPRDAIVRITSTAICGSDLHLYDGFIPTMQAGDILGHKFMGEVVEVGTGVSNLQKGDRVIVPFPIELPAQDLFLYWHASAENDPASQWLREQICRSFLRG